MQKTKILFVCLGNICRSPTAEGVFRKLVSDRNLSHLVEVDSAGTSGWHIGEAPDARTVQAAATRGYDLSQLRGRQSTSDDFFKFDYILAMDKTNLSNLRSIEPNTGETARLELFLNYAKNSDYSEVPDPYHGGAKGFELVLNLVEDACEGLITEVLSRSGLE